MSNSFLYANNAGTTLGAPINNSTTSITLATGTGSLFPNPISGQQFALSLTDAATKTNREICYCTSRTGDVCTVVRAQEGTFAQPWLAGDIAANLMTAGTARFLQIYDPNRSNSVARPIVEKLQDIWSVKDTGATADGTTDDSLAIQNAESDLYHWGSVLVIGTSNNESVGGEELFFDPTITGYQLDDSINVSNSKPIFQGPALIKLANGITGFLFNFLGSTNKSGGRFSDLDISGGDCAIDLGENGTYSPTAIYRMKFINQADAGLKIGSFGYSVPVRDSLFTGQNYGVFANAQAADNALFDHLCFIYNNLYDFYAEGGFNAFNVCHSEFVANLNSRPNVFINVNADFTGSFSSIYKNKFGPETIISGFRIQIDDGGSGKPVYGLIIADNLLGYEANTTYPDAIKLKGNVSGLRLTGNTVVNGKLIDVSEQATNTGLGQNYVEKNHFFGPLGSQLLKYNWTYEELYQVKNVQNLLVASLPTNVLFPTLSHITASYLSAINQAGYSSSASTFAATAANATVTSAGFTVPEQRATFSIWLKSSSDGALVTLKIFRSSDILINATIITTAQYKRFTFDLYQFYQTDPVVVELDIPNGITITIGDSCCVQGRDQGDLFLDSNGTAEVARPMLYSPVIPTNINFQNGTICKNSAPTVGQPKGWVLSSGTWISEGNL